MCPFAYLEKRLRFIFILFSIWWGGLLRAGASINLAHFIVLNYNYLHASFTVTVYV